LILSGVNQALDDSRKLAEDKMAPLSGGPGRFRFLIQFKNHGYLTCTTAKFDQRAFTTTGDWPQDGLTAGVLFIARP